MCAGSIDVALPSAEHVEALVGGEYDSMLWGLEQMRRRVEAAIAGVVEHAARTGHHLSDGHRSVGAWAMAVSNCSPGEARRVLAAAG